VWAACAVAVACCPGCSSIGVCTVEQRLRGCSSIIAQDHRHQGACSSHALDRVTSPQGSVCSPPPLPPPPPPVLTPCLHSAAVLWKEDEPVDPAYQGLTLDHYMSKLVTTPASAAATSGTPLARLPGGCVDAQRCWERGREGGPARACACMDERVRVRVPSLPLSCDIPDAQLLRPCH